MKMKENKIVIYKCFIVIIGDSWWRVWYYDLRFLDEKMVNYLYEYVYWCIWMCREEVMYKFGNILC